MTARAGSYDLGADYGARGADYASTDPHWVVAIGRIGLPLSFDRSKMASVTRDVSQGGLLRADKLLVISEDVRSMTVTGDKRSPTKSLSASLFPSDVNYLVEVLPGDWCAAWIVNNRTDYERLLDQLDRGEACNAWGDGFKFLGRVHSVYKSIAQSPGGPRPVSYDLQAVGFRELESNFFYDNSLASKDAIERDLGQWLARVGLNVEDLFASAAQNGIQPDNVNDLIPTLLNLIVGKGPPAGKNAAPAVSAAGGVEVSAAPQTLAEAPYAYLVPAAIGKLLGKEPADASKAPGVMAYADLLELVQGVQSYTPRGDDYRAFVPDLMPGQPNAQRRVTLQRMHGTFLPFMPEFTNRPLWQVFQQYLNPAVNEMYTCLRVNPEGRVVPTIVLRQIPFTTEALHPGPDLRFTRFLDLPRWVVPDLLVQSARVGRSDATRTNFVHVYGSSSLMTSGNVPVQYQLINNPPIRDDLDIQRSGMRPYMTTVECWVSDQVGTVPGQWMQLIADWMIGSQYTFNGQLVCHGIQSPICEGDNLEFDGVVYHVEGVTHTAEHVGGGHKRWTTALTLTNGMRAAGVADNENEAAVLSPIYPGFEREDNTRLDPGSTIEHRPTSGGSGQRTPVFDDPTSGRDDGPTQLAPPTADARPAGRSPPRL